MSEGQWRSSIYYSIWTWSGSSPNLVLVSGELPQSYIKSEMHLRLALRLNSLNILGSFIWSSSSSSVISQHVFSLFLRLGFLCFFSSCLLLVRSLVLAVHCSSNFVAFPHGLWCFFGRRVAFDLLFWLISSRVFFSSLRLVSDLTRSQIVPLVHSIKQTNKLTLGPIAL